MMFDRRKSDHIAQDLLGKEFQKAARGPEKFDCMGILLYYYEQFGINLPDYSNIDDWGEYDAEYVAALPKMLRRIEKDEQPEIGDVVVFTKLRDLTGSINHAGIFLGDGKFIHTGMKIGTKIDAVYQPPWKDHIYGYFRLRNRPL